MDTDAPAIHLPSAGDADRNGMLAPADRRDATVSRRSFLLATSATVGLVALSGGDSGLRKATPPSTAQREALTTEWTFGPYAPGCVEPSFDEEQLHSVNIPHCVADLAWSDWVPDTWNGRFVYRTQLLVPSGDPTDRVFVDFDGVLTNATVYLDGHQVGEHLGGYLPFSVEITGAPGGSSHLLAVVVDSRWHLNVPPNRPTGAPAAIDFWQPGGMYREVWVRRVPANFIENVFAEPQDVGGAHPRLLVETQLALRLAAHSTATVTAELYSGGKIVASSRVQVPAGGTTATTETHQTLAASGVRRWDTDDPYLHDLVVRLLVDGREVHTQKTRIGFRTAVFTTEGFFLNGRAVKLFGLNRHQLYPYVGAAMPPRVQRRDAEILRNELNCNMVRCSHYPQHEAFLDACDELGLMVWEEAPGWDYIGDADWQQVSIQNMRDMIIRDRNHPSVITWGSRLNETSDNRSFYSQTKAVVAQLDPSRPTVGAVDRAPNDTGGVGTSENESQDPYSTTEYIQDIFAYNDYTKPAPGQPARLRPPRIDLPYLVSEAVGTLVGPPFFRRSDPLVAQQDQAILHATVHDLAAADPAYCGLLAWCAFDYPSGQGNSYRGIKWPGVADIFREAKLGAGFYQAQVDPRRRPVIEPAFYWDFEPPSPKRGPGAAAVIWSNCQSLHVHIGSRTVEAGQSDRRAFPHLAYPPFLVDLTLAATEATPELTIDGYVDGRKVATRQFAVETSGDRLSARADDSIINADGADATRIVFKATDRFGNLRPSTSGIVQIAVAGPGVLIGPDHFDLSENGGSGAVWVRSQYRQKGNITLTFRHPRLGPAHATVTTV